MNEINNIPTSKINSVQRQAEYYGRRKTENNKSSISNFFSDFV